MSNNKSAFLGMPHGTAVARLRKLILFQLVQKCNEDICFRCGDKIKSVEDLSIEHKEPWENISLELFWDLNNIAFSHLKCNRPHKYWGGTHKKKIGENGTVWCCGHQQFLPEKEFYKDRANHTGYNDYCKPCFETKRNR